jgi:hypothetical protein
MGKSDEAKSSLQNEDRNYNMCGHDLDLLNRPQGWREHGHGGFGGLPAPRRLHACGKKFQIV